MDLLDGLPLLLFYGLVLENIDTQVFCSLNMRSPRVKSTLSNLEILHRHDYFRIHFLCGFSYGQNS